MTKNEALKLALEHGSFPQGSGVIHAIKEALAQHDSVQAKHEPEQEPVASIFISGIGEREFDDWGHDLPVGRNLLYTTPPQRTWVGLTDEEVDECYYWKDRQWTTDELVRHVEAKLKQKNGYAEEKNT